MPPSDVRTKVPPGAPPRAGLECAPADVLPALDMRAARPSTARALWSAARPRQWVKNVLVAAVPGAAGALGDAEVFGQTCVAFAAFCLASSASYLLNDIRDRESDRRHPVKRLRPIASGALGVRTAALVAAIAALAAIGLAFAASAALALGVAGYLALTAAYSVRLKHEPVFDIAAVAAGFFLRAIAGGLATGLEMSKWFLIVTAGASLFVVAGKRYAECRRGGAERAATRRVLARYSPGYLQSVATVAAGVTVVAYCLWAFDDSGQLASTWRAISVAPFVLGILHYGLLVDQGHGEEPEELFLRDRTLQGIGLCWVALLAGGVWL
jgi:decaprenyl-phosphate phosphoribosyltransferase